MKYFISLILTFLFTSHSFADNYLIQLNETPLASQLELLSSKKITFEKLAPFINDKFINHIYQVKANNEQLEFIKKELRPILIEKDYKVEKYSLEQGSKLTNDFLSGYQYYSQISGQKIFREISDIESTEVTPNNSASIQSLATTRSLKNKKDVLVAIVDTGIDRTHPELKDVIYKNIKECDEEGNVIPRPSEDKDKNGLIGDCQGWDFTAPKKFAHIVSDKIGHGTHISGIIAAKANNSGIFGIAPNVKLLPIQVFHQEDKSPFTFISTVTKAILYAVKMEAKIINLSLGWPYTLTPKTFRQALNFALSKGIIIVSSAGNDGNSQFVAPCALAGVLCVGANGIDAKLASFSNKGLHVDLVAPGEKILSTFPMQATPSLFALSGYDILSGTSQATPMVVGGIALLMNEKPAITPNEVYARLALSASESSEIFDSASGIIKVNKAIAVKKQPFIRPIVKDFQEILLFDEKNFKFNLLLKNYWQETQDIQIQITSNNPNVKFTNQKFNFNSYKQGEVKSILIVGQVNSPEVESELAFNVSIRAKGMKTFIRKHKIELLSVIDIKKIVQNSKELSLKPDEVLFYQGPELLTKMRTIPHFLDSSQDKSYWLPIKSGIKLISFIEDTKKFEETVITPPDFSKVLSLEQRDFNYDGDDDFLLRYVSTTNPEYIGYHYLSKNGDLIQNLKYYPEASVYSVGSGNYIKHETENGLIALPVWVASGKIPNEDLSSNPWTRQEQSKYTRNRIYFLEPENDQLKIRIVDNEILTKKLKTKLNLLERDHIEFRQVAPQSQEEYYASELSYILGFSKTGSDWSTYNLKLDFKNDLRLTTSPIKEYQFFGRLASMFNILSDSFTKTNHLVSNQTEQIMISTDVTSAENSILRSSSYKQKLISNVGHFKSDKFDIQIAESEHSLILYKKEDDIYQERDKISLNRVSFFGNATFRSSFLSLIYQVNDSILPAIYQDSTFLGNRKLSLVLYSPKLNKFKTSLNKSFKVPNFCTSLNPIQNKNKVLIHMLCDIKGTLRIFKKEF